MNNKLLIATNNKDKINEIKDILKELNLNIITLSDIDLNIEVEEDKETLEENALKKAQEIWEIAKIPCSADDTGLFVDALNGEPGVFSSRYAGENVTYSDNRKKLLCNLDGTPLISRTAYFRTVVCYYYSIGKYEFFDGVCEGKIIFEERGDNGFGYDAIFLPNGYDKTFAEMDAETKNRISHRGKAFANFKNFLIKLKKDSYL